MYQTAQLRYNNYQLRYNNYSINSVYGFEVVPRITQRKTMITPIPSVTKKLIKKVSTQQEAYIINKQTEEFDFCKELRRIRAATYYHVFLMGHPWNLPHKFYKHRKYSKPGDVGFLYECYYLREVGIVRYFRAITVAISVLISVT